MQFCGVQGEWEEEEVKGEKEVEGEEEVEVEGEGENDGYRPLEKQSSGGERNLWHPSLRSERL